MQSHQLPKPHVAATGFLALALLGLSAGAAQADVALPHIFSDHAVLQREIAVPIWGTGAPGENVAVEFANQTQKTVADAEGNWQIKLAPMAAGGPFVLTVKGKNTLQRADILVGEVWLCSGQSNMEMSMNGTPGGIGDAAKSNDSKLRWLEPAHDPAASPQSDNNMRWESDAPESALRFSAVGYYFAQRLRRELGPNVPIGMINSSWSGSAAEPWVPLSQLATSPTFAPRLEKLDADIAKYQAKKADYDAADAAALAKYQTELARLESQVAANDAGLKAGWENPAFDARDWKTLKIPGRPDDNGFAGLGGAFWFRREIEIPASWAGRALSLHFGNVDERDTTYFNGTQIGATNEIGDREYPIPANLVKAGRNVLTVRVLDFGHNAGGLQGVDFHYWIAPVGAETEKISLAGDWQFRDGTTFPRDSKFRPPTPRANPAATSQTPAALWNGMIAPLVPYGLRGVLWYQGESNAGRAGEYRELFPLLIKSWRAAWDEGDFPFLWVQLAAYQAAQEQPSDHEWSYLREAQTMTLALPKTAMASAIDIGDATNIHPGNKKEVGERLARAAMAVAYGKTDEYSGPLYDSMKIEGNKIRLKFTHSGGLVAKNGALREFAIAGADQKFVWADAQIEGDAVVVSSDAVPNPVAVRYAWAVNPDKANFYNGAGLPASPFRTDGWPQPEKAKKP